MSLSSTSLMKTAFPMFDMMLEMQRVGLRALSVYQPITSAFLESAKGAERTSGPAFTAKGGAPVEAKAEQVVAIGEEVLNVGTRSVPGKTTRVRRFVVESPVEKEVTLHSETVVVERRQPRASSGQDVLTEVTVEMSDSNEVPVISKSVHLVEEVLLRKEVTARTETIRDTVKRDTLEIEEPSQLPVPFNAAKQQDDRRRDEKRANEVREKKQAVAALQAESETADTKRQPH
jgi:stress response protein YsnF